MEIVQRIQSLKKKHDAVLLVHNYQCKEIQEIADFLGDSLALAREASKIDCSEIVFCGVSFMAESAKILSPDKTVLLPNMEAQCPMAAMVTPKDVLRLREQYPNAAVVCYVNSLAEVKAVSDVCCTSSNAQQVVAGLSENEVIFIPDKNLGSYIQRTTDKKIILWDGYCYVHNRISVEEVETARKARPEALLMVHPECPPDVIDLADEVFSTDGMVKFAASSKHHEFLVGTEEGLIVRMQRENPEKRFFAAGHPKICSQMKRITLNDLLASLEGQQHIVEVPEEIMNGARGSLERMLAIK